MRRLLLAALALGIGIAPCAGADLRAQKADLAIAVVGAPDPVAPGKLLTYRVYVASVGRREARSVVVISAVPAGATFVSFEGPNVGWTYTAPSPGGTGGVQASSVALAPNRQAVFQLTVMLASDLPAETIVTNTASVTSSKIDPTPGDNTSVTNTTVRPASVSVADVRTTINPLQRPVATGELLVTTVRGQNAGPMTATDIEVRVPIPQGAMFLSATASAGRLTVPGEGTRGDVVCNVDFLPSDRQVVMSVVMRVIASNAQLPLGATVTTSSSDPDPSNDTSADQVNVVAPGAPSDVSIALANLADRVLTGDVLAFDVVVRNDGPTTVDVITSSVPVPRGARFLLATTEVGELLVPASGQGGAIAWKIFDVPPGTSATLSLVFRVVAGAGQPFVVRALVTSRAADTALANNVAVAGARVQSLGDVVLEWDPPDVTGGDPAAPPQNVRVSPSAEGAPTRTAVVRPQGVPRVEAPIGYNIFVTGAAARGDSGAMLTSVTPNQTTTTVPVASGGSFFTVTAVYADGESAPSNSAGTGAEPGPAVSSVKVTSSKVTVKGTGFTDVVDVFIDGIPFTEDAALKGDPVKVVQKGSLIVGETVEDYVTVNGAVLVVVRNSDGAVTVVDYP